VLCARLRCASAEDGIALVLALAVCVVLGGLSVAITQYTVANSHNASYSAGKQLAYAYAEAGLHTAYSILAKNYPAQYPGDSTLLPARTITFQQGSATFSGTLSTLGGYWTISSAGQAYNAAGGRPESAAITAVAPVNLDGHAASVPPVWNWIYSGATGNTCDLTLQQSVIDAAPLYVAGNLCLQNTATISQPNTTPATTGDRLIVGGRVTLSQNANSIGTSTLPLSEAHIGNGCVYKSNALSNPCVPNSSATNVWVQTGNFSTSLPADAPTAPTLDWFGNYERAAPGPFRPCFTSAGTPPTFEVASETTSAVQANMNADVPGVFDLTPSTSYTCQSGDGQLSWNASTRVLTVSGTIFIDGSVSVDTSWAGNVASTYVGQAVIYVYGTVLIKNSSLCAVTLGSACNTGSGAWNPNTSTLIFAANGKGANGGAQAQVGANDSVQLVSANFQGGLYGTNAIEISTTSNAQGPLVSPSTVIPGQSGTLSFPSIQFAPLAIPGNTGNLPAATLSPLVNVRSH
jgi:hypothetical protein